MPLDRTGKESLLTFAGVNLRRDALSMADGDMVRAINADVHTKPGVLLLRKGSTPYDAQNLGAPIRQIARHNAALYQIAGASLFRNFAAVTGGFATDAPVALATYRPLNDVSPWVFIIQGATKFKNRGTTLQRWGIDPPSAAPAVALGAAGSLTGTYRATYTYARVVAGNVAHQSNPAPTSAGLVLTADVLSVAVVASPDPQVTHIRIYRTVAGGTSLLFDQQVANTTATITSSQADTALGTQVETDNDVPPSLAQVAEYQAHFFGVGDPAHPDYLWYAKRWLPESWGSNQFVRIGADDDPLNGLVRMAGFLGVFSRRSKYRVSGNSVSGFAWAESLNTRGTLAPQALLASSAGVGFWADDGIFVTNFLQEDLELSAPIAPLFESTLADVNGYAPVDLTVPLALSLGEYRRRLYAGYQDLNGHPMLAVYSRDTQRWYFYEQPCASLYYDESTKQLLMGATHGLVLVLETGTTDNGVAIALNVETAVMTGGDRFVRKIFKFCKLDVLAQGSGGIVEVLIDDIVVKRIAVNNTPRRAARAPMRLQDMQGYGWAVRITGSIDVFGVQMLYAPIEDA